MSHYLYSYSAEKIKILPPRSSIFPTPSGIFPVYLASTPFDKYGNVGINTNLQGKYGAPFLIGALETDVRKIACVTLASPPKLGKYRSLSYMHFYLGER